MIVAIVIAFLIAAALGALSRAEIGRRLNRHNAFPLGTLLVNCSGSFALGLLAGASAPIMAIVGVGFLGAFTTVSSFARDVTALLQSHRGIQAVTYMGGTIVLTVLGAWFGLVLADL